MHNYIAYVAAEANLDFSGCLDSSVHTEAGHRQIKRSIQAEREVCVCVRACLSDMCTNGLQSCFRKQQRSCRLTCVCV